MKKESQEKKFVRVAEGIYRYRSGGFYARATINGKATWQKLKCVNLNAAKREAHDVHRDLEKTDRKTSRHSLAHYADVVLEASKGMAPRALKNKTRVITKLKKEWPGSADTLIGKVKTSDIRTFMVNAAADASSSYYNFVLGLVRNCLQAAIEDKAITEIPGANAKREDSVWKRRSKDNPVRLVPSVEQFRAIVADIRSQEYADTRVEAADFVEAEGLLGIGQAEIANMRWSDVSFSTRSINLVRVKTQKPFTIPIYPQAQDLLKRRKKITGENPENHVFKIKDPKIAVANACARLKLPKFSQRSFRRTFVTEALRQGVNVKIIADFQGHRDGGKLILQTYSDVIGEKERLEAAKKIAQAFSTTDTESADTEKQMAGEKLKKSEPAA